MEKQTNKLVRRVACATGAVGPTSIIELEGELWGQESLPQLKWLFTYVPNIICSSTGNWLQLYQCSYMIL